MLTGLLLAGLLASTALPDLLIGREPADDGDEDGQDLVSDSAEPAGAEIVPGATLELMPEAGVTVIRDFNPGTDRIDLHIGHDVADLTLHDAEPGAGGTAGAGDAARLTYVSGDSEITVAFDGLAEVPVDDIGLVFTDAGGETVALVSVLEEDVPDAGSVLLPTDPTLSDLPPALAQAAGTAASLATLVPEAADLPDMPDGGEDITGLQPILDPEPLDMAPSADNTIHLALESVPAVTELGVFVPGEDILSLSFDDVPMEDRPEIAADGRAEIEADWIGPDAVISLNGEPVLLVLGGAGLVPSDIRLDRAEARAA